MVVSSKAARIERRLAVRSNPRDKQRPLVRGRLLHLYTGLNKNARPALEPGGSFCFSRNRLHTRRAARGGGATPSGGYNPPRLRIPVQTTMFGKKIKTGYESDATRLIRDLLREKPQLLDEQARGRSLWWDRKLDLDQQQRVQASRVPQKGYVYQSDGD
jgi:Protein of unknown function (DUF3460)